MALFLELLAIYSKVIDIFFTNVTIAIPLQCYLKDYDR